MRRQRRGKRQNKAKTQKHHFKKRALERYGIAVNSQLYAKLVELVQSGQAELIERQSLRVAAYWLELENEHAGTKMRVIYDRQRKTLVTALPPEGDIVWHDEEDLYD